MNTNSKVWLAMGIFLAIIISLCIFMVLSMPRGRFYIGPGTATLRHTTNLVIDSKTEIDLTAYDDNVHFLRSDSNELVIKEYYESAGKKADIRQTGNRVFIQGEQLIHLLSFGGMGENRIEVYLPSDYAGNMEINLSSGTIKSDIDFSADKLSFKANSGNVNLRNLIAGNISIRVSSGSIYANELRGETMIKANSGTIKLGSVYGAVDVDVTSGSVNIGNLQGRANIDASSGSITVTNVVGSIRAKANSGTIKIGVSELAGDVNVTASSGSINIDLPKDSSFNFTADTSSGSIRTDFDNNLSFNSRGNFASGTVGNNPVHSVKLDTKSGSVRVSR